MKNNIINQNEYIKIKEKSGALSGAATASCGTAPDAQFTCINTNNNESLVPRLVPQRLVVDKHLISNSNRSIK